MQLTTNQKTWLPCPDCEATATILNMRGHRFAGTWECIKCNSSGECNHENLDIETVESQPSNDYDLSYESEEYVCKDCDCTVDQEATR